MKVLIATDKPFAKIAVDGIRKEVEAAGFELALLEKYTEKQQWWMPMPSLSEVTLLMLK